MSKIQIAPTLIDVVVKHEQQIQELKRLLTPMMEFNPEMPTKICGPKLEGGRTMDYDSPGPAYTHVPYPPDPPKEWVNLTDEEITEIRLKTFDAVATNYEVYQAIQAKLKQKNGGDSAVDTELQRLGYPL